MANSSEGLDVRQLLESVCSVLSERHNPQQIVFPDKAYTEITEDSDWHRKRYGYMGYESAGLYRFGGKTWAIARGEKFVGHPAGKYDSDILALEFLAAGSSLGIVQERLKREIGLSSYFFRSLIRGLSDGNLDFSKTNLGDEMSERVRPVMHGFIAQMPEYDPSVIKASTMSHPIKKPLLYRPEFADLLADSIEAVLR